MPYTKIYYVKVKLEILNDKRFIFDCDPHQKWLFLGLLLLAGDTQNHISSDENYIKNRLNLAENPQKIKSDLDHLLTIFPKMVCKDGYIKFKNFKELHNYFEPSQKNPKGTPKELQKSIQYIVNYIILLNNYSVEENPILRDNLYRRFSRPAKELALLTKQDNDKAKKAIDWVAEWCRGKGYSWNLNTVVKHYADGEKCGFKNKSQVRYD